MNKDWPVAYLYHDLPKGDPFEEPGYRYTVLMIYSWNTQQSMIRYWASEMGLKEHGLLVFPCVLSDDGIECSQCVGLRLGECERLQIKNCLEEYPALHLMSTVVGDCCNLLRDAGYSSRRFHEASYQLWRRANEAGEKYRARNKARLEERNKAAREEHNK